MEQIALCMIISIGFQEKRVYMCSCFNVQPIYRQSRIRIYCAPSFHLYRSLLLLNTIVGVATGAGRRLCTRDQKKGGGDSAKKSRMLMLHLYRMLLLPCVFGIINPRQKRHRQPNRHSESSLKRTSLVMVSTKMDKNP